MFGKKLGKEKNLLLAIVGSIFLWKGLAVGVDSLLGWVFILPGASLLGMLAASLARRQESKRP